MGHLGRWGQGVGAPREGLRSGHPQSRVLEDALCRKRLQGSLHACVLELWEERLAGTVAVSVWANMRSRVGVSVRVMGEFLSLIYTPNLTTPGGETPNLELQLSLPPPPGWQGPQGSSPHCCLQGMHPPGTMVVVCSTVGDTVT